MQIIQISDLHISSSSNIDSLKNIISKLYDSIRSELRINEDTVICILGDIVEKGDMASYASSSDVIRYLKDKFTEFSPAIEFIPGNHDLCACPYVPDLPEVCQDHKCTQEHYYNFVNGIEDGYDCRTSVSHKKYREVDLIFASSVYHNDCKYGLIDVENLGRIVLAKPTLLITHHTFLSESTDDISAIRNAYKVFDVVDKKNIVGILHGHTHGYKNINIGNKCPVIGVGPFLKEVFGVNNQANLVIVTSSGIHRVTNYFYSRDLDRFEERVLYSRDSATYTGPNIGDVYRRIVSDVRTFGAIPNMNLKLKMPYDEFNRQIEETFPESIHTAELWQNTSEVPSTLYYNHGQYMKCDEQTAVNFVTAELQSKATSSRAIIPLINFENVVTSGDGFLPSFDLVQFGFLTEDRTQLFVTLYLRALEVNHFLKINICEIYLMCRHIADTIRSIKDLNVEILAFKAQFKENFGCFLRAQIDTIDESDLVIMLEVNLDGVVQMLEEKKRLSETVIESKGMVSFFKALNSINKLKRAVKSSVLESAGQILEMMEELKVERKKTSNYKAIEKIENRLSAQFDVVIKAVKGSGIYES